MRMITNDPAALADRRVERGVAWLRRKAVHEPVLYDWERRLIQFGENGQVTVRWPLGFWNEECPLAYAFEPDTSLAGYDGRVKETEISNRFQLSDRWLFAHGFNADYARRTSLRTVYDSTLRSAWLQALLTYARPAHIPRRHLVTELDRELETMQARSKVAKNLSWWEKMLAYTRMLYA